MSTDALDRAAHTLARARGVVALTGAGVSAESGIPTFRDPSPADPDDPFAPLWAKYDPMQLATPDAFEADTELVTRWYDWRVGKCSGCQPNPAHHALAQLEQQLTARGAAFTLLTQNVDGLHRAAGSHNLHELHGSVLDWRCSRCNLDHPHPGEPFESYPPPCRDCRAPLRPGVVWFGEALPAPALEAAERAMHSCDCFLSIGTSAVVYPAAGFAHAAKHLGATVIELNKDPTPLSDTVDIALQGNAGELLPDVVRRAFP